MKANDLKVGQTYTLFKVGFEDVFMKLKNKSVCVWSKTHGLGVVNNYNELNDFDVFNVDEFTLVRGS